MSGPEYEINRRSEHYDLLPANILDSAEALRMGVYQDPKLVEHLSIISNYAAEMQYLAFYDTLTEIYNRRGFIAAGRAAIYHTEPGEGTFATMLDVNYLKETNDVLGHHVGDRVLQIVAQAMAGAAPDAVIGRLGGDEFALIDKITLTDTKASRDEAMHAKKEALRQRIIAGFEADEELASQLGAGLGVAIGQSALYGHGEYVDIDVPLREANEAMRAEKNGFHESNVRSEPRN